MKSYLRLVFAIFLFSSPFRQCIAAAVIHFHPRAKIVTRIAANTRVQDHLTEDFVKDLVDAYNDVRKNSRKRSSSSEVPSKKENQTGYRSGFRLQDDTVDTFRDVDEKVHNIERLLREIKKISKRGISKSMKTFGSSRGSRVTTLLWRSNRAKLALRVAAFVLQP